MPGNAGIVIGRNLIGRLALHLIFFYSLDIDGGGCVFRLRVAPVLRSVVRARFYRDFCRDFDVRNGDGLAREVTTFDENSNK